MGDPDVPIQGILDFDGGNPDGFENWRREREALLAGVREEWGLPLGRRVRVCLIGVDHDLTGRMDLRGSPPTMDRRRPLELRVDGVSFLSSEIERCEVIP